MADKELSAITAATKLDGTEIILGSQGVNSRKLTARQLASLGLELDTQAGTAYAAVVGDAGKWVRFTAATAVAFTLNTGIHSAGDIIVFEQAAAGIVTVTAGAGFTLRTLSGQVATLGQYHSGSILFVSATEALILIDAQGTMAFQNSSSVAIAGGAIENTPIGATTPSTIKATNLHVESNDPRLRLEDTDGSSAIYAEIRVNHQGDIVLDADPGNAGVQTEILFFIDGSEKVRIESDGNFGIGTPTPSEKLEVVGNIKVSGSIIGAPFTMVIAVSDETTDLTTGTAKITIRMPAAVTLTEVRASAGTAPTGSALTVDINEAGVTILSTKLTIDATEKTSTTAAVPAVISDSALADDAEMTIDIDTIGSTIAGAGLKVTLIGKYA